MDDEKRLEIETRLIEETRRIGDTVREITPEGGIMNLFWWPDGHVHVQITERGGDNVICAYSMARGKAVIQL